MGRLILLLGILLIVSAIAFMGLILSPNTVPFVAETMVTIYCEPPETQITVGSRLNVGGSYNSSSVYFCEDDDGNRREISDSVGLTAAIGFIVLLLTGILLLVGGIGRMVRNVTSSISSMKIVRGEDGLTRAVSASEQQEVISSMFSVIDEASSSELTLTERLQQLEDARNQGLISSAEYERTRQAILDSMNDL